MFIVLRNNEYYLNLISIPSSLFLSAIVMVFVIADGNPRAVRPDVRRSGRDVGQQGTARIEGHSQNSDRSHGGGN